VIPEPGCEPSATGGFDLTFDSGAMQSVRNRN
jgi:hypothetical protein